MKQLLNTSHFTKNNSHVTSHVSLVSSDVSGHVPLTVYKQHYH